MIKIHSNGPGNAPPDDIETLKRRLREHALNPDLAPFVRPPKDGPGLRFFGNFEELSAVFWIEADDPALCMELQALISANVASIEYAKICGEIAAREERWAAEVCGLRAALKAEPKLISIRFT